MDYEKLSDGRRGENLVHSRACQCQRERFAGLDNGVTTNAEMRQQRSGSSANWMKLEITHQSSDDAVATISRAYHRSLKLARVIADMVWEENIQSARLQYRFKRMIV